jgi:hypothetical protein
MLVTIRWGTVLKIPQKKRGMAATGVAQETLNNCCFPGELRHFHAGSGGRNPVCRLDKTN